MAWTLPAQKVSTSPVVGLEPSPTGLLDCESSVLTTLLNKNKVSGSNLFTHHDSLLLSFTITFLLVWKNTSLTSTFSISTDLHIPSANPLSCSLKTLPPQFIIFLTASLENYLLPIQSAPIRTGTIIYTSGTIINL